MRWGYTALALALFAFLLTIAVTATTRAAEIEARIDPLTPVDGDVVTIHVTAQDVANITSLNVTLWYDGATHGPFDMTWDGSEWTYATDELPGGDVNATITVLQNESGVERELTLHLAFAVGDSGEGAIPINVILLLSLMGLVIFVGFVGSWIFDRFGIPEVFSLILLGILIGSVFNVLSDDLMTMLRDVSPLFAAIALLIILFDGGINLSLDKVIKESSKASLLAILAFVMTMFAIGAVAAVLFFDMKILPSLMLGAALGGTSGAIVIPTVMNLDTDEEVKVLLSLESTITDVLCIVAAVAIADFLVPSAGGGSAGASGAAQSIIGAFAVGIFMGGIGGILWLRIMPTIEKMSYGFMLTIAFVFVLYALTQFAGGSGPVAALAVGLVLANGPEIGRMFRYKETTQMSRSMKQFQSEITFFVKSFFFVYTGLLFTIPDPTILLYGVLLALIIMGVRAIAVRLTMKDLRIQDRELMTILGPRGLSAAVLATLPLTYGFEDKHILTGAQVELFTNISLIVILATVLVTTVGIPWGRRRWTLEHMEEIERRRMERRQRRAARRKERRLERERRRLEVSAGKAGTDSLAVLEEEISARGRALEEERKEMLRALEEETASKIRDLRAHHAARLRALEEEAEARRRVIEEEIARRERTLEEEQAIRRRALEEEEQVAMEAIHREMEERRKALIEEFRSKKEALERERRERREALKIEAALETALGDAGTGEKAPAKEVPEKEAKGERKAQIHKRPSGSAGARRARKKVKRPTRGKAGRRDDGENDAGKAVDGTGAGKRDE